MGRKRVYRMTLMCMVFCSLASGLSFGSTPASVMATSSGSGLASALAATTRYPSRSCTSTPIRRQEAPSSPSYKDGAVASTPPQADYVWRVILMFGAIPALLTYYWRMKMPETARYTVLVTKNAKQAAAGHRRRQGPRPIRRRSKLVRPLLQRVPAPPRAPPPWHAHLLVPPRQHGAGVLVHGVPHRPRGPVLDPHVRILLHGRLHARPRLPVPPLDDPRKPRRLRRALRAHLLLCQLRAQLHHFIVSAEIFPARFRSTCHGISKFFASWAPSLIGSFGFMYLAQNQDLKLVDHGYNAGIEVRNSLFIFAACNFLGMGFTFLATESNGILLEELSGENDDETRAGAGQDGARVRRSYAYYCIYFG